MQTAVQINILYGGPCLQIGNPMTPQIAVGVFSVLTSDRGKFNTCKCHNTASYYKLRRKKMEKVDRKPPNPKTLDIQKKPDRKWVLVCPRKQILTTQVLADTEHGQGTRLCTDGTDPKTFRSSSSHPVHVETIGQGLGIFSWSTV